MSQFIETHNYIVETISPIHIWSGEKLLPTDYVIHGGSLYAINMDRLIGSLKDEQAKIFSQIIQKGDLSMALGSLNIKPTEYAEYVIPCGFQPGLKLQTHIKDTEHMPYIPGSSIKGAIRTAICYNLFAIPEKRKGLIQEIFKRSYSEKAEKEISNFVESIFGSEDGEHSPHYDVMKFLRISDSKSVNSNFMEVREINVVNRNRRTGIKIYAEVIKSGLSTSGKLTIDKTLYQKTYLEYADEFPNYKIPTSIDTITSYVNNFTSSLIDKEIDFAII